MKIYLFFFLISVYSCEPSVDYPLKGIRYPDSLSGIDTTNYIFPVKDSLSTKDSFLYTNYYRTFFHAFGEPNLSVRPQQMPVYRMLYSAAMDRPVVVTLTQNQIVVKELIKGSWPEYDTTQLSLLERKHYVLLEKHFPLQEVKQGWRKRYVDSLVHLYPELLDARYYQTLRNKARTPIKEQFVYKTETIPISKNTYARLVNGINSSDFWDEPYLRHCDNPPMDGYGFTLEANTPRRYKIVETPFCSEYSRSFHKAWQELADFIKMGKRLNLDYKMMY